MTLETPIPLQENESLNDSSEFDSPSSSPNRSRSRFSLGKLVMMLLVFGVIGGGVALSFPSVRQQLFPEKVDYSHLVTKMVVKAPFQITVEAKGTIDSSRNASLASNVEGSTTIISIVPAGSLVHDPLRSKATGVVSEIKNKTSGTPDITVIDEDGQPVKHNYELTEFSEFLVAVGDKVEAGDLLIGDLVCELDSATLVDAEKQQQISVTQADADLEKGVKNVEIQIAQNESDLSASLLAQELAQLDLKKYEQGEYVQEVERISGEIKQAEEELERAIKQFEFTKRVAKKGYKTSDDVKTDEIAVNKATFQLAVKKTELKVLEDFTRERTMKELKEMAKESFREYDRVKLAGEAALAQFEAEVTARKLTYKVQESKLEQQRRQIKACKLIAPQAGQVVYANDNSRRSEPTVIEEGMTVRERQKLINLPDMTAMKVDARIHESKISNVKPGLPVEIRVDAIPAHIFTGVLDAVSSVPLPGSWPNTDLKQYEATVRILDSGAILNELKPGMTANIKIVVESAEEELLQVPVQAVVKIGSDYYTWVQQAGGPEKRLIQVGKSNDVNFVVESGVELGDLVVMNPQTQFSEDIKQMEDKAAQEEQKNRPKFDRGSSSGGDPSLAGASKASPETPAVAQSSGPPAGGGPAGNPEEFFKRMDKDGDGKLSGDEIPSRMSENLSANDADGDGAISLDEFKKMMSKFAGGGGRPPAGGSNARGAE